MQNPHPTHSTTLKGNPWPRLWQTKDLTIYQNDSYFKEPTKSYPKVIISSPEDFLPIRKYYRKKLTSFIVTNTKIPNNLKKRVKHIKKLKIYANSQIQYPFYTVRKLTLCLHPGSVQANPSLSRAIRGNKHINSLRISNFRTFQMFLPAVKTLAQVDSLHLDVVNQPLTLVGTLVSRFIQKSKNLKRLGIFLKDTTKEDEEDNEGEDVKSLEMQRYAACYRILNSILECRGLQVLKLDLCLPVLLEENGTISKTLLAKLTQRNLDKFDIRLLTKGSLDFTTGLEDLISQLDYLAITTDGEAVHSIFGDSAERLSLHKTAKKMLMLNFESSPKIDLPPLFQASNPNLTTLDLQIKGENFNMTPFAHLLTQFSQLENLLLFFEACSSKIVPILKDFLPVLSKLPFFSHFALLFQNIVYSPEIYSAINKFLLPLHQISYLNMMMYHNLRTSKQCPVKVHIDKICSTISSLSLLKTLKFSANPPWEEKPLLVMNNILPALHQLEKLSLFLWLKTESKVLFSIPLASLSCLKELSISIYFRLEEGFLDHLMEDLGQLTGLKALNISIAYYNKLSLKQFKRLLKKLGALENLDQVQLNLNVTNEERDKKVDQLQGTLRRGLAHGLDALIQQINRELEGEKKDLKDEVEVMFRESKCLKKVLFLHAAKQYFSAAYAR